jgi:hypothetical protein
MVADIFTPIGPVFPVFQLKDLFDFEIFSILGIGKMYYPKAAAAYISYDIAGSQVFPLRYAGKGAVKVNRNPRKLVGNSGGYILNGLAAKGTSRNRYRFGRQLGRRPAGTLKKRDGFPGGRTPATQAGLLS